MKVFNLTDVETPVLKQRGLCQQTFAVGKALVAPGQSADVDDAYLAQLGPGLRQLVSYGAAAVGQPPASYRLAKEKMAPVASAPEPAPAQPPRRRGGGG
jgi:hypothetical protein